MTSKAGGSKPIKPGGSKPHKSEALEAIKSTLAITAKTTMSVNPFQPPMPTVEILPLTNMDYKIADPVVQFNLLDIHN